jgi:hypothetical protein
MHNYKFYLLFIFGLIAIPSTAQLTSLGFQFQNQFSRTPSHLYGGEISRSGWLTEFGLGYLVGNSENLNSSKLNIRGDLHILPWHHAYLGSRLAPYIGAQYEYRMSAKQDAQSVLRFRTGLKLSYDYFIFDGGYQLGDGDGIITARLAYVIHVGNRCSQKRINEITPHRWDLF